MSTHLTNVLMQQSTGPKKTMPTERPVGELLLALNEFNKYELYTGTGDGTQPLFSDGTGSSNISFITNQDNASSLNGKFVYFDNTSNTWKPAYAQASPGQNEHYTAQGFAIYLSSNGTQITTSGKLIVPFKLTDYTGQPVVAGSYYYLCQEQENAGLIQQSAPSTGIMQIVCQVISVDDTSTTLLLLNDLSQVADDVIVTSGDGSKYLGDDGQYHPMMIAGLAGRTTNCIGDYEILDINFENVSSGENSYGYVKNGDITIEDNIASNFSDTNYIISKYMVENNSQYSFRVRQKFTQVTNLEVIFSTVNKSCYLGIENGLLKFVLNGNTFKGELSYDADTYYHFRVTYSLESGYVVSSSTDGLVWTNEIIIYDETNYLDSLTIYLGVIVYAEESNYTSGAIDLANSGFDYLNNDEVESNYPLSNLTDKNISTITVTFKGNGIVAAGRAAGTTTLSAIGVAVDTKENTIIANDATTLIWDTENGLTTTNYSEIDYERKFDDEGAEANSVMYAKDTNLAYKYTIIYPNFLHTNLIYDKEESGDVKLDFSSDGASFHPNKFLNRNGFTFELKLDMNGDLKLYRTLDATNYGGNNGFPFYYGVQGVDWTTFQSEGGYVKGVKISSALASTNAGTANGSTYQSTVNDNNYAEVSYAAQNLCAPGFMYYSFEKPINFTNIVFRNYSDVNYIPTYYCMHVSNDMQTWYSIMPTTATGYTENGSFRHLPVDVYATFPNRKGSALHNIPCKMPDENEYYKYFRIGLLGLDAYRPLICGLWVGMQGTSNTFANNTQTAKELIFETKDFINTETSGINAQVVRKKVGTSYQVRFLDKLGYVNVNPEDAIIDEENKKLAPNDTVIYQDDRLQIPMSSQILAYQTHCKQFLKADRTYGLPLGFNTFQLKGEGMHYSGCATTGTVTNSFQCLMTNNDYYDFANGTGVTSYVVSFPNKARVGYFYMQNHPNINYDPQWIKIYGAVTGGSVTGTIGTVSGATNPAAVWEEIPITKIIQAYNKGNFNRYAPTEEPNTYVIQANSTNHYNGNPTTTNYGAYNVYIAAEKAYQQYKIEMQRPLSNRIFHFFQLKIQLVKRQKGRYHLCLLLQNAGQRET